VAVKTVIYIYLFKISGLDIMYVVMERTLFQQVQADRVTMGNQRSVGKMKLQARVCD
jgi:hypothetical protein